MEISYEKTVEIEIINELSASVYNRVLNYVLNHELDTDNTQLLEVNLLNQLKLAKRVNLFEYSLDELQAVHDYWRSMNRYSKQILAKEKVA
ncbi:antitoxin [Enterococcus raffinosus]|uniref:antitoxin n=1 Tax=Enterococcus raffinosus TaxID=71452 RepID=UPI00226FD0BA|nr:antitoxin [Enterococcus faecium]